jgi:hypothetical protein
VPFVVIVGLVACGAPSGESIDRLRVHEISQGVVEACTATARSVCARAFDCEPRFVQFFFDTTDACEKEVAVACTARYAGPGASGPPVTCADIASMTCERLLAPRYELFSPIGNVLLASCAGAPGAFHDGEACLRDGDCASDSCSVATFIPGGFRCGRCAAPPAPRFADGSRCTQNGECVGTCRGGVCGPLGHDGDYCTAFVDCAVGLGWACGDDHHCGAFTIVTSGDVCIGDAFGPKPGDRLCDLRNECKDGRCIPNPRDGTDEAATPNECVP